MNPLLLATIPGLIAGAGLALLLLNYAPRTIRGGLLLLWCARSSRG